MKTLNPPNPKSIPAARSRATNPRRRSSADVTEFRTLLLRRRAELYGDVAQLRRDHSELGFASPLYEHAQRALLEIEAALQRIEDGTYGICDGTSHAIARARLRAIPWARRCFECAMQRDRPGR